MNPQRSSYAAQNATTHSENIRRLSHSEGKILKLVFELARSFEWSKCSVLFLSALHTDSNNFRVLKRLRQREQTFHKDRYVTYRLPTLLTSYGLCTAHLSTTEQWLLGCVYGLLYEATRGQGN
jgi:hypothetical protein